MEEHLVEAGIEFILIKHRHQRLSSGVSEGFLGQAEIQNHVYKCQRTFHGDPLKDN